MNVEKYNKPMTAVLGMNKTNFHVVKLQSTTSKKLTNNFMGPVTTGIRLNVPYRPPLGP
jgi:ribosomal protein S17E